jgi:3-methyladenine DNA glycosylase AlkD
VAAPRTPDIDGLSLIEREATDDRHFVKKAVNMALRAVGKRNRAPAHQPRARETSAAAPYIIRP